MKVLVFENNLMWSTRLLRSIRALGHEADVAHEPSAADAAIVNLGSPGTQELVKQLKAINVVVIGHAGHKEKDLHELGREAGCDILATNSELTYKIESILGRIQSGGQP